MSEPHMIVATRDPVACSSPEAAREWISRQYEHAKEIGCTFGRFSWQKRDENGVEILTALMVEAWLERPDDQGVPRWNLATYANGGGVD